MAALNNINILLGVCGGIAAYKSAELVRALKKQGANVKVVLTRGGKEFITPLTLQTLSGHAVHDDIFDPQAELTMSHIDLARWADRILIAPTTADMLAKLATGIADDLLTTICIATKAPILLAPAMNQQMWLHWATQDNVNKLTQHQVTIIGPGSGEQACGEVGPGRMSEPNDIVDFMIKDLPHRRLDNIRVLITAGPTHEAIDSVRYLSNQSSGKMGYALAEAAANEGATVTLISGPTHLNCSAAIERINVTTAQEMLDNVKEQVETQDIMISTAAVADYTVANPAQQKIKKTTETLQLELTQTIDILGTIGAMPKKPFLVGFAAETENLTEHATEKLTKKNADMIIANLISDQSIGFNSDHNAVTVITRSQQTEFEKQPKTQLAKQLISLISDTYQSV